MRTISKLMILVLLIPLFSCTSLYDKMPERDRLMMTGRYGEAVKLMEKGISQSGGVANKSDLGWLCEGYSLLKRYDKLFECCDRLEKIPGGLAEGIRGAAFSPIDGLAHKLRAEAYIDLAQGSRSVYINSKNSKFWKKKYLKWLRVLALEILYLHGIFDLSFESGFIKLVKINKDFEYLRPLLKNELSMGTINIISERLEKYLFTNLIKNDKSPDQC